MDIDANRFVRRGKEVLSLVAQGSTTQTIMDKLIPSLKTVRNQVFTLFGKLQGSNRAEAIIKARMLARADRQAYE